MFKALSYFTDLQDNNYSYHAGDIYPRKGYEPTKERIKELSTDTNCRHVPVIVEIDAESPIKAVKEEKSTIPPEECINPPAEAISDDTEVKETKPKRARGKAKKNA